MASLRARLIVGLLVLAAAGLLVLGGVTYAEQRSFLYDRIDQQTQSALPVVSRVLDEAGVVPASPTFRGFPGERRGPEGLLSRSEGRGGPPPSLPQGTYGERRDPSGRVLGHVVLSYGQAAPSPPALPSHVGDGTLTTVDARADSGPRYRVTSFEDPDGSGQTIIAVPLREVDQTLHRLLLVELLVIGGVLLALGALAYFVVRLGLRPLDRMARTAGAIAAGDLSRRVSPATPKTEVGRLGIALNGMLARLEEAFDQRRASEDRLRRFLADASHELRTPLAAIRGYSEVFRIGAAADPAETDRAMRRIEEEAARMGVLVEDLLTLARLDEVHAPVRREVDVTELARDAIDDARVTAAERPFELHADGPAVVVGDPHQLGQVLGNLVRNALVHTPAGTPIEIGVSRNGAEVELEVRDHGPGLPEGQEQALFERFWRAERGRGRGRAGAGLGLAIVAAIVDAHGGRVQAANAPDGGARFTVRLPAGTPARRPAVPTQA
jgi:two-component system, OmpR family, sensor kinase